MGATLFGLHCTSSDSNAFVIFMVYIMFVRSSSHMLCRRLIYIQLPIAISGSKWLLPFLPLINQFLHLLCRPCTVMPFPVQLEQLAMDLVLLPCSLADTRGQVLRVIRSACAAEDVTHPIRVQLTRCISNSLGFEVEIPSENT